MTGLSSPTAIGWAPDGRMFIALKDGRVRVFENGQLLPTDFIDISAKVNSYWDHGLLGIAVHPSFPITPHVYLLFTHDPPDLPGNPFDNDGPDGGGERVNRLIRVSAFVTNTNLADPKSEVVLLGNNSILANIGDPADKNGLGGIPSCDDNGTPIEDCLPSDGPSHSIGTVIFGSDGSLYAGSGEGTPFFDPDPRALRAQNLDSLAGKILRIDPDTGHGYPDNPFYDGDPHHNRSKVWSYGLRNPFRFAIHPVTNEPFIGDVGWYAWEEINTGKGKNFGWPCYEGDDTGSAHQPSYEYYAATQAICAPLYAQEPDVVQAPLYAYEVGEGAAVLPGAFYTGTTYPPDYQGALFIADYDRDWIKYLTFDINDNAIAHDFAQAVSHGGGPVQLTLGPDENLYYVVLNPDGSGEIRRIRYEARGDFLPTAQASATPTIDNRAPTATITMPKVGTTYSVGDTISFSGTGTDVEDGALSGSSLEWEVLLHHKEHIHYDFFNTTGTEGSFVAPDHADHTWLELCLTVTDSGGLQDIECVELHPNTVIYTFDTQPSGLQLIYAGISHTTPFTVETIVNAQRLIIAPPTEGGLDFISWSDGGEPSHVITISSTEQTYLAEYR
ncbi:MAG: PQQ-dependent sugar dehydrogenase [Anaerolineae bacterium]